MLATSTLMITTLLAGCDTPAQKVEMTQENVTDSVELERADEAYLADMENYRKETTQKLEVYTKNILAFKAGIENEEQENKADYQNRITALEQQNSELKMKMENFEEGGKEKWEALKNEIDQGMDEMDRALNDSTLMDMQ